MFVGYLGFLHTKKEKGQYGIILQSRRERILTDLSQRRVSQPGAFSLKAQQVSSSLQRGKRVGDVVARQAFVLEQMQHRGVVLWIPFEVNFDVVSVVIFAIVAGGGGALSLSPPGPTRACR